jgi:predicted ATP-binding protein involved in virulence
MLSDKPLPSGIKLIYKDIINPYINYQEILTWFNDLNNKEARRIRDTGDLNFKLPELELLRDAISKTLLGEFFWPNFDSDLREMTLTKKGINFELPVSRLSQGFQSIFLITLDLVRRMIQANRDADFEGNNLLHTPAIVLIDEIELHLHPSWQQKVLPILLDVFPNTQFIVTTHSPQIITSIKPENVVILQDGLVIHNNSSTYGTTSSTVLTNIFSINDRPDNEVKSHLDQYFKLLNDGQFDSEETIALRKILDQWLTDDPVLVEADLLIKHHEIAKKFKNAQTKTSD